MLVGKINYRPSVIELKKFGLVMLIGFGVIGALVWWRDAGEGGIWSYVGSTGQRWSIGLWLFGVGVCVLSLVAPTLARYVYVGWMLAAWPIGMVISTVMVTLVFYLLITPIGLVFRLMGRDKMGLRKKDGGSYWIVRSGPPKRERYLRQY